MHCRVIAVGKQMPSWVNEAWSLYRTRLKRLGPLELIEIAAPKRSHQQGIAQVTKQEAQALREACLPQATTVALDRQGASLDSLALAKRLTRWREQGRGVNILIGGPEGIDPQLLKEVDERWSLSPLTLAHPVARVVLAEQLFRAWSITQNHPYHR
jgi:23S rRNA (pseudouridine1915-N3)-methyltransferase